MRKVLKWIGIFFGGLIGLLLTAIFVTFSSNSRIDKTYDIQPEEVAIHNNDGALALANTSLKLAALTATAPICPEER